MVDLMSLNPRPPVARVYQGAEATRRRSLIDDRLLVTMEHFIVQDVTMDLVWRWQRAACASPAVWNSAVGTQLGSHPEKHW
jgi:hypothetical protein